MSALVERSAILRIMVEVTGGDVRIREAVAALMGPGATSEPTWRRLAMALASSSPGALAFGGR